MRVRWCGRVVFPIILILYLWITISWLNKQRTNKETMSKLPVPTPAWPCQTRRGIRLHVLVHCYMVMKGYHEVLDERERFRRQQNRRFRHLWWVQDGAPPHRGRDVMARLQELFGDRIVTLNQPVEWTPRSPDLTPLDFFMWGVPEGEGVPEPPPPCQPHRVAGKNHTRGEWPEGRQTTSLPCLQGNASSCREVHGEVWWSCGRLDTMDSPPLENSTSSY